MFGLEKYKTTKKSLEIYKTAVKVIISRQKKLNPRLNINFKFEYKISRNSVTNTFIGITAFVKEFHTKERIYKVNQNSRQILKFIQKYERIF